ncbi:DUF4307 domain-containing protein [Hoyosella sp. G463]|uniref:DUF4307 domain-containing protein n=1 Tax=Lolliginicoccus lacisalsi TaxID=2742202 RepID=A0A927JCQ2_9ACTN|nr:DUF4307 domain-containing protein [Lolliginicoccus lacisalsi]MBD8506222.1 DUF4307 domain-containing protein [Lolliginicoccus lacisalsi]
MSSTQHDQPPRYPEAAATGRTKRPLVIVLGVLFALGIAVIAYLGYRPITSTPIEAEALGYEVIDDATITVRFKVVRDDPSADVVCIVRSRSRDGSETGRREVLVPGSTSSAVEVTTTITTSKPPGMAEVYGCGGSVPQYLQPQQG